jgi:hypothetical protein
MLIGVALSLNSPTLIARPRFAVVKAAAVAKRFGPYAFATPKARP